MFGSDLSMSKIYSYKDYDKYLSLKVGFGLWLVVLFLLRPYVLLASSLRGVDGVGGLKDLVYHDDLSLILGIIATFPVLIFIYVWVKRMPGASAIVRKAWKHGKLLLIASALLSILGTFLPKFTGYSHKINAIGWAQIVLSILVIVYLHFSQRVNDTFADFPEDQD